MHHNQLPRGPEQVPDLAAIADAIRQMTPQEVVATYNRVVADTTQRVQRATDHLVHKDAAVANYKYQIANPARRAELIKYWNKNFAEYHLPYKVHPNGDQFRVEYVGQSQTFSAFPGVAPGAPTAEPTETAGPPVAPSEAPSASTPGPTVAPPGATSTPTGSPDVPVQRPADLDAQVTDAQFQALDPTERTIVTQVLGFPIFAGDPHNQGALVSALTKMDASHRSVIAERAAALATSPLKDVVTALQDAFREAGLTEEEGHLLAVLAKYRREVFALAPGAPGTPKEEVEDVPNRDSLASKAAAIKALPPSRVNTIRRAAFLCELAFKGIDITNTEEIFSGDPKVLKMCKKDDKLWNTLAGLVELAMALKGEESAEGGKGGPEKTNQTPEQQAEAIGTMPLNTMVNARLDTTNGQQNLVVSPKTGNTITPPSLLERLRTIDGASGPGPDDSGVITIPRATSPRIDQVAKIVRQAVSAQIDSLTNTTSLNAESKDGIKNALNSPGTWVEGGQPGWTYIFAHNKIVGQKMEGALWVTEFDGEKKDWKPVSATTYFDKATGEFPSREGKKYNPTTKEWETMTDDERKDEMKEQIRNRGASFIVDQQGGSRGVGDRYFVNIPWDKDDLHVRFNETDGRWEFKEQDEEGWHVPGDGNLPDDWSGDGLTKVRVIDDGLQNINQGKTV